MKKFILMLFFCSALISSCSSKKQPKIRERCEITEECFAAQSQEKLDELTKYCARNSTQEVKYMIGLGEVTTLMPELQFVLLEANFPSCKVEVTNLLGEKSEWWISSKFLKEK